MIAILLVMLPINLHDLTCNDIQRLIDSEVTESLTLEYKEALPTTSGDDKREFLYDVAAMANRAGGDIVYGLADRRGSDSQSTGIAECVAGMKFNNAQTEIARLASLIKDGITPRLAGVVMQPVSFGNGDVLVIRVPRSWAKPHMVTLGGVNKFVIRGATGKNPMSVEELRRAFSEQGELHEAIGRWRSDRAAFIGSGGGPIGVAGAVTMLFHVIPASAFSRSVLRESWSLTEKDKRDMYVPHLATSRRYNADGFLCVSQMSPGSEAYGYTQLFRSGIIEFADSQCAGPAGNGASHEIMVYGQELEKQMLQCYQYARDLFRRVGQSGDVYVGFSLVGIANKSFFSTMRALPFARHHPIRANVFNSPEVFVDFNNHEGSSDQAILLPLVDTMWQVAGLEGSPFKANGVWDPLRNYA
jgi:hypothetical protein